MLRYFTRLATVFVGALCSLSAVSEPRLPVFDVHLHAMPADAQGPPPLAMCTPMRFPLWDPQQPYGQTFIQALKEPACEDPIWSPMTDDAVMERTINAMERNNVIGVLSGTPERVATWMDAAPKRFVPGLGFNLANTTLKPDDIKALHQAGRLSVFAEITNQYSGIAPNDERMEPYWAMAESLDLPVGIHVGPGPPGAIYLGSEGYRGRLNSALTLEEVLVKHPKLRVYIMHAGFPLLDDLLAILYAHPQVYAGLGIIVFTQPKPVFYRYLKGIVDAGFGERVMFGSDQMVWPEAIDRGIAAINDAPFLSAAEKRDILYNNAARFLRFTEAQIKEHHKM